MKQAIIVGTIFAGVLLLSLWLWPHRMGGVRTTDVSTVAAPDPTQQSLDVSGPSDVAFTGTTGQLTADSPPRFVGTGGKVLPKYEKYPDLPVTFFGLVVDQDSNALPNVKIDMDIGQWDLSELPDSHSKLTHAEGESGPDGRFDLAGVNGHYLVVRGFRKEGYEPELLRGNYGEYNSQTGSPEQPVVFRLWNTNLHEKLVEGERGFGIIPDGRHYGIDLLKGTMVEGDDGDLVVWIKRPEKVTPGIRYDWSCELRVPNGGLVEDSNYIMFRAPEKGYTNIFTAQEKADSRLWGYLTGDKRFYVQVRNGKMYGRIVINLYADYHAGQPAMIVLSYAINPSGSRFLR